MTRIRKHLPTAGVSLLAGLGGVATSYAVSGPSRTFVASPVERALTDVMPGAVIAFMIENAGSLGQQFNVLLAVGLTAVLLGGVVAASLWLGNRTGTAAFAIAATVGGCWLLGLAVTGATLSSAGIGLGAGVVVGLAEIAGHDFDSDRLSPNNDRRRVLTSGGVAIGLGALGVGANALGSTDTRPSGANSDDNPIDATTLNEDADGQRSIAEYKRLARERSLDVDGIEPLLSEQFYNVDISGFDPNIDRENWSLSVTGNVENELELTYEDIRDYRAENRMVTLRCVGDSLNGKKVDNAVWTGVPMGPILEEAVPQDESCCVMLRAADDFYEEFPLSALREGLLAFGMNGQELPRAHGYPLRALIPGHWGEINVKWLTEIEILEEPAEGYWEKKGWHGTGPVNTVAKLWDGGIVRNEDSVTLAGHAYAGTRGIDRVEVSTDGGETWAEATLTDPLPGEDVWRQWRYEVTESGTNDVVVRAVDGEGQVQSETEASPYPRGASGWVEKTVTV